MEDLGLKSGEIFGVLLTTLSEVVVDGNGVVDADVGAIGVNFLGVSVGGCSTIGCRELVNKESCNLGERRDVTLPALCLEVHFLCLLIFD